MTAEVLLRYLDESGVKLTVTGELLSFTAPKGALPPERMKLMRQHKQELIRLIKQRARAAESAANRYRAAIGQESLWLLHQADPNGCSYNTAAAIRILSPVDTAALQRSLARLRLRHESLHTTFCFHDNQVFAELCRDGALDFRVIDAAHLDDQAVQALCQDEYATPFNLHTGPLFRARLVSRKTTDHVLLLVMHHIIFDATSLWILQSELQQLYAAESTGQPCLLPAVAARFSEYARWQHEFVASPEGERQWKTWSQHLSGDPSPGELPWTFERPRDGARQGATVASGLDEATSVALRRLAKELGATPFATAMAVFQTLVHRYGNQLDFVVGTATAGRTNRRFSNTIGYFVNVLPLRCGIGPATTFASLVQQTRQSVFNALQGGEYPFAQLIRRLNPARSRNAPPLCRLVFGLHKAHAFAEVAHLLESEEQTVVWGGLCVQRYPLKQQEGQFDLTLELYEGVKSYDCVLKYDQNLMSEATARRFLRHYGQLLRSVTINPHKPLGEYAVRDEEERQLLASWSSGETLTTPEALTFDRLFGAAADRHGGRVAFVHEPRSWTYAELDEWSTVIARCLRARGVRRGDCIIICAGRHAVVPACLLAALKCGAVYVPIAADTPRQRLAVVVKECRPALVVADGARCELLREMVPGVVPVLACSDLEPGSLATAAPDVAYESGSCSREGSAEAVGPLPSTSAYIIHTSGSSGVPKAVTISHRAICLHVAAMARVYRMDANDRVLQFSDLTFDPSIEQFLVAWSVGATVVMRGDAMYTGEEFREKVAKERVTVVNVPPSFLTICAPHMHELPDIRLLIVGGDVFPGHLLAKLRQDTTVVMNAYGPTEAVVTATTHAMRPGEALRRVPIGRPKPGSRAWVLDQEGRSTGIGIPGELCLGGPMLADGYLSPTADGGDRFQRLEVEGGPPERLYRTGDMARWNENGELEFLGRIDRQIKIRGFRIEPGEIETTLAEHRDVQQAFVRACEEREHQYLAAYVLPRDPAAFDPAILVRFLKSKLPAYMVPERIGMVTALPLNHAGKVAVEQLPMLPASSCRAEVGHVPPRNAVEQLLAEVWAEILEVDRVGIHDDYYLLGGGSLQSLRIVSRLRERGGVARTPEGELTPQLLFQYVTIAELSPLLAIASPPVVTVDKICTASCPALPS
jgi:amino acid adenylation domain-containing protein